MPVLFQKVITGDTKYTFTNDPSCTVFDVHNDNPFNCGVSFGRDTGILNADYYASPGSILYGIVPPGSDKRTVGGVKFSGTIYLYTQTPIGGGVTDLTKAPALSITVIGYPSGSNPSGTTSMNRATNIMNPVDTTLTVPTHIANDGNAINTPIVEATPGADPTSAVLWTNNAVLKNGNVQHPGQVAFDNNTITSDGTGVWHTRALKVDSNINSDNNNFGSDGAGNVTMVTIQGLWKPTNSQPNGSLTHLWDSNVAAHISTYNANQIAPQVGAGGATGISLGTRDAGGALHRVLSADPAATEIQAWIKMYLAGALAVVGASSLDNGALATDGAGNFTALGSGTTFGGATSGTFTAFFPIWGTGLKVMVLTFANYNNASGTTTVSFPSSVGRGVWLAGWGTVGFCTMKNSGTGVNVNVILTLAGTGGTDGSQANISHDSVGWLKGTANQIGVTFNTATDGALLFVGA